jgi:hypothetical protein
MRLAEKLLLNLGAHELHELTRIGFFCPQITQIDTDFKSGGMGVWVIGVMGWCPSGK